MIGCGPRLSEDKYIRFTLCLKAAPRHFCYHPGRARLVFGTSHLASIGAYKAIRVDGGGGADIRPCF